jgi:hypothetical protein
MIAPRGAFDSKSKQSHNILIENYMFLFMSSTKEKLCNILKRFDENEREAERVWTEAKKVRAKELILFRQKVKKIILPTMKAFQKQLDQSEHRCQIGDESTDDTPSIYIFFVPKGFHVTSRLDRGNAAYIGYEVDALNTLKVRVADNITKISRQKVSINRNYNNMEMTEEKILEDLVNIFEQVLQV